MKEKSAPKQRFNFDFIGHRKLAYLFTATLVAVTLFSIITKGFNFGIDFTGGIVIEIRTETATNMEKIRKIMIDGGYGEVNLQAFADPRDVMIRVQASQEEESQQKTIQAIKTKLDSEYGEKIEYRKVDYVGPQVGSELLMNSIIAVGLSMLAILAYVWSRFNWHYGVGTVVALLHDAVLTFGFFSVTGIEFDLTSVAAILTIVGYSVNDSVVIYDRVRENFRKYKTMSVGDIINLSVNGTLSRTFLTGGTVILSSLALLLFGGKVIFGFAAAMLFGVVIGTYSSVYISALILLYFKLKR